jgi:hypothetical protein
MNSAMSRGGTGRRRIVAVLVALFLVPLAFVALPVGVASATTMTTTTISTSSSATYFSSASLTVTVTATGGNPTTGTIDVSDSFVNGDTCTITLSGSDQGACTFSYFGVGSDTITATYLANGSYASSTGHAGVSVSKATVSLSASASAATVGQSTTVTVQATPSIVGNTTGVLTVTDSPDDALDCSTTLSSGTQAQCTSSPFTSIGADSISVSWAGNTDYNSASTSTSLYVGQASTLIASVTVSPGQVGQTATVTVQVQPTPDGGDVSVTDHDGQISGCTELPVNTLTGQATCTTPVLTEADASDAVSASYLGDPNYEVSGTGTGTLDIARGATSLSVTGNPGPSVGSSATYVATVTPSAAVAGGGTVDITDSSGDVTDCSNLAVGAASCESLSYSSVGSDTVSATFGGNMNWAPASGSTDFSVAQGQPNVMVSLSPTGPTVGEHVTISAVVSPTDGGGTVAFSGSYISGCGAVTLSGNTARCTTTALTATGSWTVTATYSGDTNYSSAFSGRTVTISAAAVTVTASATNSSPVAFAADTLIATISPIPDGGTVDFTDSNGTISGCGIAAVNTTTGVASCSIAALPGAQTYDVTATYSGDSNYLSNSGQLALNIAKIPTTILVSASPTPVTVGGTTTLTITVSPIPDSGSATVTDSFGDLTCSGVAIATSGAEAGTATCTTRALSPAGTDTLTTSFTGSSNYLSASGSGSVIINRITSSTTVSSADSHGLVGGALHVSVTVSPIPTSGTVSFSDSLGQLGVCASVAVNVSTGVASCTSGTLVATGPDTISATFQQTSTEASSSTSTTIPIEEAPAFSGSLTFAETAGSPASAAIQTIGYPAPSVMASAALPNGISLSSAGVISGTPVYGSGGIYLVPVTATNALNTANATITVVVDQVPAVTSATTLQAAYGAPASFLVSTATGTYPTPSYALSGGMPAGMSFADNHDGTATLSGTPIDYVSGAQSFSLVVSNSAGTVSVPFTIDVTGTSPVRPRRLRLLRSPRQPRHQLHRPGPTAAGSRRSHRPSPCIAMKPWTATGPNPS